MLLAQIPLPCSQLHSTGVPQIVAGRRTEAITILCIKADVRVKCRCTNVACVWSDKLQGCSQQDFLKTVW